MGRKAILLQENMDILEGKELESYCVLLLRIGIYCWNSFAGERIAEVRRTTKETDIYIILI